jgi:hypothetical protein
MTFCGTDWRELNCPEGGHDVIQKRIPSQSPIGHESREANQCQGAPVATTEQGGVRVIVLSVPRPPRPGIETLRAPVEVK